MDFITQTWHWSISGFFIGMIMLSILYFGKSFGMSSNLRTMCTIVGSNRFSEFFNINWREQKWNLAIVLGSVVGGFISFYFLSNPANFSINPKTIAHLQQIGIEASNGNMAPSMLFSLESVMSIKGFLILILGGFLIGFGTPYAGGCTSGHAITGLSNLQFPSLLAVIGFFLGGLVMAHFILPLLF